MRTIVRWLTKVPFWVWVFLTITQILNLVVIPLRIYQWEEVYQTLAEHPVRQDHLAHLASSIRWEWFYLMCSVILAPLFFYGALWRWRRKSEEQNEL